MTLIEILEILIKGIVQTEEKVEIRESTSEVMHGKEVIHFHIKVQQNEVPLLVGKGGSTIKALRVIMSKLAGKHKKSAFVDLDESK